MMKPEPSDVTWRGVLGLGPRKFLNRSSSGEPGGSCGMAFWGGAFKVWLVELLTTIGNSLFARSAKESGAGRAQAGGTTAIRPPTTSIANRLRKARMISSADEEESAASLGTEKGNKQAQSAFCCGFFAA